MKNNIIGIIFLYTCLPACIDFVSAKDMAEFNAFYNDTYLRITSENSCDFQDNSYSMLRREREQMQQQSKNKGTFLILGILIVLPIALYFVLPQKKQKLERRTPASKDDMEPLTISSPIEIEEEEEKNEVEVPLPLAISEEVVDKILMRLEEFEKKHLYVKTNISLSHLAIYCDTNAKYLSVIINSYKKNSFYNYINELRINYIIEKLTTDPYYRRLKIAVLAKEVGFSSQSKFAVHFKKITSLAPSEFIKSLPASDE